MEINYWQCRFKQHEEHPEADGVEGITVYGCSNPKNETGWCGLNNKSIGERDECSLIDFLSFQSTPEVIVHPESAVYIEKLENVIKVNYQNWVYYVLLEHEFMLKEIMDSYESTGTFSILKLTFTSQYVVNTDMNAIMKLRGSAQHLVDNWFSSGNKS